LRTTPVPKIGANAVFFKIDCVVPKSRPRLSPALSSVKKTKYFESGSFCKLSLNRRLPAATNGKVRRTPVLSVNSRRLVSDGWNYNINTTDLQQV
jgi:hypothetical protein